VGRVGYPGRDEGPLVDANETSALAEVAAELNDQILSLATGFSGSALLGKSYVYRIVNVPATKGSIVSDWLRLAASPAESKVPRSVLHRPLDEGQFLSVETKLPGTHPATLQPRTVKHLLAFLVELHSLPVPQVIDQFEGERLPAVRFWDWLASCVDSYGRKLARAGLDAEDLELVMRAGAHVDNFATAQSSVPEFRLLHKDIHPANLLVEGSELLGVIDWDAAMLGPIEWELAIFRQRFPERRDLIASEYTRSIDEDLLKACGLVQALRFWKSFPAQVDFVSEQRKFITELLDDRS
jgi:hypothetical protein